MLPTLRAPLGKFGIEVGCHARSRFFSNSDRSNFLKTRATFFIWSSKSLLADSCVGTCMSASIGSPGSTRTSTLTVSSQFLFWRTRPVVVDDDEQDSGFSCAAASSRTALKARCVSLTVDAMRSNNFATAERWSEQNNSRKAPEIIHKCAMTSYLTKLSGDHQRPQQNRDRHAITTKRTAHEPHR